MVRCLIHPRLAFLLYFHHKFADTIRIRTRTCSLPCLAALPSHSPSSSQSARKLIPLADRVLVKRITTELKVCFLFVFACNRPPLAPIAAVRLSLLDLTLCWGPSQTAGGIFLPDTNAKKNEGVVSTVAVRCALLERAQIALRSRCCHPLSCLAAVHPARGCACPHASCHSSLCNV